MHDPSTLPADLPVPENHGEAEHLRLSPLPDCTLPSTSGTPVHLASLDHAVLFFYPRTGVPGQPPSVGFAGESWDSIPGARGCTPQSCSFRDLFDRFDSLGVRVLGISTNTTEHQREFKQPMHMPFDFLSDSALTLTRALSLPTFEFPVESGGPNTLLQRMAWYITCPSSQGPARIMKCWYPVFPPDQNAHEVARWVTQRLQVHIEPIDHSNHIHHEYIVRTLKHHWHDTTIYSRRVPFDAASLPGYIAWIDGQPAGCITCARSSTELEVITLAADLQGRGIGAALLDTACREAAEANLDRLFLTTTNDNLHAQEFYQRQGLRLVTIHENAVDAARAVKPDLPVFAPNGLAIRDEWEYQIAFSGGSPVRPRD